MIAGQPGGDVQLLGQLGRGRRTVPAQQPEQPNAGADEPAPAGRRRRSPRPGRGRTAGSRDQPYMQTNLCKAIFASNSLHRSWHPERKQPGRAAAGIASRERARLVQAGVGVQAGDDDVHHEEVERHRAEAEQVDVGGAAALPAGGRPGVQVRGVDDPGDEGPGLLRVPAPVPAPGRLGPDRAEDDAGGVDRERERDRPVGRLVQRRRRRQPASRAWLNRRRLPLARSGSGPGTSRSARPRSAGCLRPPPPTRRGWPASTTATPAPAWTPWCRACRPGTSPRAPASSRTGRGSAAAASGPA